jgi:hypothetical protein
MTFTTEPLILSLRQIVHSDMTWLSKARPEPAGCVLGRGGTMPSLLSLLEAI